MRTILPLAALAVALCAGCSEDKDINVPPTDPRPDSPSAVVSTFVHAIGNLDMDAYAVLPTDDFRLHLTPDTVDRYALADPWLDRDGDLASMAAAFSGEPAARPGQPPALGLDGIDVLLFNARGAWGSAPAAPEFPGAVGAGYDVEALVFETDGLRSRMRGVLWFYVRPDSTDPADVRWGLAGLVDQTGDAAGKRSEPGLAWGGLKVMFLQDGGI
jgi:hypothetical protein